MVCGLRGPGIANMTPEARKERTRQYKKAWRKGQPRQDEGPATAVDTPPPGETQGHAPEACGGCLRPAPSRHPDAPEVPHPKVLRTKGPGPQVQKTASPSRFSCGLRLRPRPAGTSTISTPCPAPQGKSWATHRITSAGSPDSKTRGSTPECPPTPRSRSIGPSCASGGPASD